MQLTQGSKQWKELRRRAEEDLYFFNATVLGFADKFPMPRETHQLVHTFMQRTTGNPDLDEAPIQLLMWPRETGKSTCGTVGYAIWEACKNPDIAILIANEKEETAKDFIKAIKWHFEANGLLRALFPEVLPPDFAKVEWSATRATLNRSQGRPEATFDCTGVGGTKTGKHYDIVLCDDLISKEAMENARRGSWSMIEETNRWVNQLEPMLSFAARNKYGKRYPFIRFIGTRWWAGDTYEHIMQSYAYDADPVKFRVSARLPSGNTVSRTVQRAGDIAKMVIAGIEDGRPTFPDIWPMERMEKLRFKDPELFSCNIMNDPSDAAVRTFQDSWLQYWAYPPGGSTSASYRMFDGRVRNIPFDSLIKTAVTDPAFTSTIGSSRAAIVVVGTDMGTGKHLVLDVSAGHKDPKDNLEDFLNMLDRWQVRRAYVELAGQQKSYLQWLQTEASRRNLPCAIETVLPGGRSKDARIEGLMVPFKNGDLYVHPSQSELIDDEYRHWRPGHRQSDVLDALAYAMEQVPKPAARSPDDTRRRADRQLANYYQRRGFKRKIGHG